ncbi:MAG: hypothetical protein MZV63_54325 [Marinilabiliales bacterium]|nr:hypothetical protein [Marinilabiliales bacterium]
MMTSPAYSACPGVSGVGVSFGADRIYDVMLQLDLFPEQTGSATEVLVINFGGDGAAGAAEDHPLTARCRHSL